MTKQTNVNSQMQQLAESAVVTARDKFGVSLDFTKNSLLELDKLLQQAYEGYKQVASNANPAKISIENTVQIWGSYLGEVIRRNLGGNWIVDQKNVLLQVGNRRLDPFERVRSRVVSGPEINVTGFYDEPLVNQPNSVLMEPRMSDIEKYIEKYVNNLKSPKANTRYEACEYLRVAPSITPEAIKALENALNDPDRDVADAAQEALNVLAPKENSQKASVLSIPPSTTHIPGENVIGILRFLAWADLIAGIILSIWVWIRFGTTDVGLNGLPETNPIGVAAGFGVLVQGILFCVVFLVIAAIEENVIEIRKKLGV